MVGKKNIFFLLVLVFSFSSCEKTDVIKDDTELENPSYDNNTNKDQEDSGKTEDTETPVDPETPTEPESPDGIPDFRITMNVSDGIKVNRASVDEGQIGSSQLQVRWDNGDKVRMMIGSSSEDVTACDFTLVDTSLLGIGSFEYLGKEVQTNYYYGMYPTMEISLNGDVQLNVPVDGSICQAAADDSRHLGQFRPMYAPPVQKAKSNNILTGVIFKHLTSLIVFKVTNLTEEAFNLKSIELFTADNNAVFYSSANFNPQKQTEVILTGNSSPSVCLGFEADGMQLMSQEMKKAYLPLLPSGDFSKSQLKVKAMTDKGGFVTILPIAASQSLKSFKAGSYCIFNLKKNSAGITVGVEFQEWEDGGMIDIPIL